MFKVDYKIVRDGVESNTISKVHVMTKSIEDAAATVNDVYSSSIVVVKVVEIK